MTKNIPRAKHIVKRKEIIFYAIHFLNKVLSWYCTMLCTMKYCVMQRLCKKIANILFKL